MITLASLPFCLLFSKKTHVLELFLIIHVYCYKGVNEMIKRKLFGLALVILLLAGCSAGNEKSESGKYDGATEESYGGIGETENNTAMDDAGDEEKATQNPDERKVMYSAFVTLEVDDIDSSIKEIEKTVTKEKGYVVEVNFSSNEKSDFGSVTLRIPTESLTSFLEGVEEYSGKVKEKRVVGQDVTEEYVDLTSRLKAKRVVEERLLDLLSRAEKTEDLLKISNDLSIVQEEIEQVMGRMKYLDNKTEYAEVKMEFIDVSVNVPEMKGEEELKTGEKIKQTFAASINSIVAFFSWLAIFLIGYSPILFLLATVGILVFFVWRKRVRKSKTYQE